jgi:hypothetical protein
MLYAEHKILIQNLVDNKLFNDLFTQLKAEVAADMMQQDDVIELMRFRNDIRALDRLQGKLTEIANEMRMV